MATSDPKVEQLLREGIAAARAGDRQTARAKLREVVTLDQQNEQGWFWLASVAETLEERRICLGNVIIINPDNEKAKRMLDQISFSAVSSPFSASDSAQDNKALIRTVAIVGAVVVVLLVLVIVLLGGSSEPPPPTLAVLATATPDDSLQTATAVAAAALITQTANAEGTRLARQLPPTWTPVPTPTPIGGPSPTPLPSLPFALNGRLIVQYGTPLTRDGYLPLFLYDLASGQMTPLTGRERGDYGRFVPDGRRFAYARLVSGARQQLLFRIANLNGSQPQELSSFWQNQPPLADQAMLSIARNGNGLVFIARNVIQENDPTSDVYYLPLVFAQRAEPTPEPTVASAPEGSPTLEATAEDAPEPTATILQVRRVTARDSGVNTWSAISPDGSQIAFVSDRAAVGGDGHDIYVVPVSETFTPERALTSDGDALIESGLAWSPDGQQLLFSAGAPNGEGADLFIINADGSDRRALVENFGECIRPLWSPDGQYVVFSSKRSGKWELYVVEVATGEIYQLTQTSEDVIVATDWR